MRTITIEVTQTIDVTLDETKFTPEFMKEYRESFYDYTTIEQHAKHLAFLEASGMVSHGSAFIEGYGPMSDMGIKLVTQRCVETECV